MELNFRYATVADATLVGGLVVALTEEICRRTDAQHFDIDLVGTIERSRELIGSGAYRVLLGYHDDRAVAFASIAETYALYAGGKVAIVQEFYVDPLLRSGGVGARLIEQVKRDAAEHDCACIELCTPPLPEFERTLTFYQQQGLAPVGGRKMRCNLG